MDLKDVIPLLYPPTLFTQLSTVHGPVIALTVMLGYVLALVGIVLIALFIKKKYFTPNSIGKDELDKSLAVFSQQLMTVMGEVARRFEPHLTNAQVDVILEIYFKIINLSMIQEVMQCSRVHKESPNESREELERAICRSIETVILTWDSQLKKLPESVTAALVPSAVKIEQIKELASDMADMAQHQSTYHHITTVLGSKLEYVMLKWKVR